METLIWSFSHKMCLNDPRLTWRALEQRYVQWLPHCVSTTGSHWGIMGGALWAGHYGRGIMGEALWAVHYGLCIMGGALWAGNHGCGIMGGALWAENHGRGIMGGALWAENHGRGIISFSFLMHD